MSAFVKQVEAALKAYVERGREALALLEQGEYDAADELLTWRKAAFHNFRMADSLEKEPQARQRIDRTLQSYGTDILQINLQLAAKIEEVSGSLRQDLQNQRVKRQQITKFHSGTNNPSGFQNSI